MKTIPQGFFTLSLLVLAAGFSQAQVTPDFMAVDAQMRYNQTGASSTTAVVYNPGVTGPYVFSVFVEANADLSGNTAPTFTVPGNSTYSGSLTLAPTSSGGDWRLESFHSSSPFSGGSAGLFPGGTYAITQPGASPGSVTLNLSNTLLFPNTPVATITGGSGTWSGNTLMVSPGTNLTITTNSFTGFDESNGALFNHIGLFVSQGGTDIVNLESASDSSVPYFGGSTGQPNFLSSGSILISSGTYFVEMEFNAITSADNTTYAPAIGVSLYTVRTSFFIQAIPEPSTYAAMFGGLALVGVAIRRRGKQQQG